MSISKSTGRLSKQTNWHAAFTAAIKINLKDYETYLEYLNEYFLIPGKRGRQRKKQNTDRRIDLLVIKKTAAVRIPINFASFFRELNIFEIKGRHDTLDTDAYYKGISYAGQLISQFSGRKNQYTRKNVTLTFVSMSYPRKLMKHLKNLSETEKNSNITIENNADGIYYIYGETFLTQIIVAGRLSLKENKFLRCICDGASNPVLLKEVADEYLGHKNDTDYVNYMNQMLKPTTIKEADNMCEAIFELFGTSSEEIAENATREANIKIQALSDQNTDLSDRNTALSDRNTALSNENMTLYNEISTLKARILELEKRAMN